MANVSVKMPMGAVSASGKTEVAVDAATVRDALDKAIAAEPSIRARVFREDGRMYAGVFLRGRNISALDGLDTTLHDGDVLKIVPPISGG
jgi:molybdopterin converting factor small subunit